MVPQLKKMVLQLTIIAKITRKVTNKLCIHMYLRWEGKKQSWWKKSPRQKLVQEESVQPIKWVRSHNNTTTPLIIIIIIWTAAIRNIIFIPSLYPSRHNQGHFSYLPKNRRKKLILLERNPSARHIVQFVSITMEYIVTIARGDLRKLIAHFLIKMALANNVQAVKT